MFSSNKVSNVVENAIKSNNKVNLEAAENGKLSLASILVGVLIVLVINILVGPYLWNNVLVNSESFVHDPCSLHLGIKPDEGEKWALTVWSRIKKN